MPLNRRSFLRLGLALGAGAQVIGRAPTARAEEGGKTAARPPQAGCLVDTTLCIGCRKCEEACNRVNRLNRPRRPFADRTVLSERRRTSRDAFTVVNAYPGQPSRLQNTHATTFVKSQCMHCLDPACVSACLVGAITRAEDGPVVYDASKCLGCRYCMVACPFGIPAYEYDDPITPRMRKCQFCANRERYEGARPACAAACPVEATIFGDREQLLRMARHRIQVLPDRYQAHIYGEKEVGGTSWLYLTGRPYQEIGLLKLPEAAPPRRTEAIQHGIFRYAAIPTGAYLTLAGIMWYTNRLAERRAARPIPGKATAPASSDVDYTGDL